jgi:ribonuclease-3
MAVWFDRVDERKHDGKQPWFVASIEIDDKVLGRGSGTSKKEAQQNASKEALEQIKIAFAENPDES